MANPSRQTMGNYCRRTYAWHISFGFQLENLVFYMKNVVLLGLRDNQFDRSAIWDPWKHLTRLYETCHLCIPNGVIESRIKLRLFGFSLARRAKDWLQCLLSGTIQTWTKLEEKFIEIFFTNAQFVERRAIISNFSQGDSKSLSDTWERAKLLLKRTLNHNMRIMK